MTQKRNAEQATEDVLEADGNLRQAIISLEAALWDIGVRGPLTNDLSLRNVTPMTAARWFLAHDRVFFSYAPRGYSVDDWHTVLTDACVERSVVRAGSLVLIAVEGMGAVILLAHREVEARVIFDDGVGA